MSLPFTDGVEYYLLVVSVSSSEQLNLTIHWVTDGYEVHEDPVGLFRVPDTTAETLFTVIKDMLIQCTLPLSLCRGQAYDDASNMQGKRSGVATRFRNEQPAAIPVHCFCTFFESVPTRCRKELDLYQRCPRNCKGD